MKKIFFVLLLFILCGGSFLLYQKMNPPEISVVMSTYNRAKFLPRSIESILNQTFPDFEFIIINDGSTDNSADILKQYAKKDSRIRIITNEQNKGLVYSLNKGLDEARGKYIARMDDDDVSLPTRFAKQHAFMEKHPDIAVVGSWVANPYDKKKWDFHDETSPEKIKLLMYVNVVPISHPASFLRLSFLNEHNIRYNDEYKAAEDRKFWLDIMDKGGKITNIPEELLLFRMHQSNPKQYYMDQWRNLHKFFHKEVLSRFGKPEEFNGLDKCEIMKKMAERNKKLNLISQPSLEAFIKEDCVLEGDNKVKHAEWFDRFIFKDNNKVCRYKQGDCATIIDKTPEYITIKWDEWGQETFERIDGIWISKR